MSGVAIAHPGSPGQSDTDDPHDQKIHDFQAATRCRCSTSPVCGTWEDTPATFTADTVDLVYESNYTAGLIFDGASIPSGELDELAWFDVFPEHDEPEFVGTWSNYARGTTRVRGLLPLSSGHPIREAWGVAQGDGPGAGESLTKGVLTEAWEMYKAHWQHLFQIALAVYVVIAVAALVLSVIPFLGALLTAVISLVGVFWLQAALVKAVEDVRDGRVDLSLGETFTAVRPYIGRVAIASIVAGIGIFIGLLLLIVPGLFLLTIWAVIIPVIVLEDTDAFGAFGRSRELVRGRGMSVFGLIVLTFLILIAFGIVLALVLSPFPEGVQTFLSDLISGTVVGPFVALAWTLLYYRLRGVGGPVTGTSPPPESPSL